MSVQTILEELGRRPGGGDTIPVINPATEDVIVEFRDGRSEAVDEAVDRARNGATSL